MLWASSSCVRESLSTSAFSVESDWSNSRFRSSLMLSAARIFASISFRLPSFIQQKYSLRGIRQVRSPSPDARQDRLHVFPDFCANQFDSSHAIHHVHAAGFGGGDDIITLRHPR